MRLGISLSLTSPVIRHGASGPLNLTNNQKLSLPPATLVGTQVNVTDIFQPTGSGSPQIETVYFQNGTLGGKAYYPNGLNITVWNSDLGQWEISRNGLLFYTSPNDTEFPWQATYVVGDFGSEPPPTLTNPLPQQLNAPNATVTAMFPSGAGTAEANVIYTQRGTFNEKPQYNALGLPTDDATNSIKWVAGLTGWGIYDSTSTLIYFSLDDTATPDLAVFITAVSGSDPAPTVAPIPQGDLDAGLYNTNAGLADYNGVYPVNGSVNGFPTYASITSDFPDGIQRTSDAPWDQAGVYIGGMTAFPWQASWTVGAGTPPAPTVVQSNPAGQNNWGPVTP